ncbi:hypothetical protein CLOSTMETH_01929 [[Clostridium] methylpentosum DSM 5476]|uniref:Uncharacterized protein n=1 Tax=[Clostridium] methylpentosum DSM 5476 TaxID=537013 RepID=C0EDK2_9FIRM|nr:hypothetical protein CLOSTMETH_01929 [[Clostridium] methylpentosum DSM 5476]
MFEFLVAFGSEVGAVYAATTEQMLFMLADDSWQPEAVDTFSDATQSLNEIGRRNLFEKQMVETSTQRIAGCLCYDVNCADFRIEGERRRWDRTNRHESAGRIF